MKLPVNYADVRMEQLLQRIQTSFEMVKDEESKRMIIEWLLFVLNVITNLIKERSMTGMHGYLRGTRPIEKQSDGSSSKIASKYYNLNYD